MHKKLKTRKHNSKLTPEQVCLPGMNDRGRVVEDYLLPVVENPFVDRILALRRKKSADYLLNQICRRYLDAETVLGINTASGYRMRRLEMPDWKPVNLLLTFFCEWFKLEFKADLHPLFPSVLEDMGFASDDTRIITLWESFLHEKGRGFLKLHPGLLNLLANQIYSPSGQPSEDNNLAKVLQNHLLRVREI